MVSSFSRVLTNATIATSEPTQADIKRRQAMQLAWKAYRGELPDPMKVARDQPNDNVKANRCAPIADKGSSFLFGQVLKIECEDQILLDSFWGDDDDKMTTLVKLSMNGAACGQVFVKLVPSQETGIPPRIVVIDPSLFRIITLPDDCDTIVAYIIEYPLSSSMQKKQIIARVNTALDVNNISEEDIEDTWNITNYTRQGDKGYWTQSGAVEVWPYPFPPIFSCQNLPNPNEPWGIPDLSSDLIEMNKVLNFILSNIARVVKYHGHPVTWASGVGSAPLNMSPENMIVFQSDSAKIEKIAAMENFTGMLSVVADLRSDMDEQSRVPAVALGRLVDLPKGNISGVALALLFQPLIEKTVLKQRLYGRLIREVSRAALVLMGTVSVEEYATYQIDIHWQNLLPVDDLAAAQTAMLLSQLGVSQQTLLQQLGYNPDDESEKSQEEDQQKMQAYTRGQALPPPQSPLQGGQQPQQEGMSNE
jgi:Phage portal protein, SPP1 Gp6-like